MRLNVVPVWLKILLVLTGIALLVWSMRDTQPSAVRSGQHVMLARPQASRNHGLPGKIRNNLRQLVHNPLGKPSPAGEEIIVLRDNSETYYRDEN